MIGPIPVTDTMFEALNQLRAERTGQAGTPDAKELIFHGLRFVRASTCKSTDEYPDQWTRRQLQGWLAICDSWEEISKLQLKRLAELEHPLQVVQEGHHPPWPREKRARLLERLQYAVEWVPENTTVVVTKNLLRAAINAVEEWRFK